MKKVFIVFVLSLISSFSFAQTNIDGLAEQIARRTDFRELLSRLDLAEGYTRNLAEIKRIKLIKEPTKDDQEKLALALGFSDVNSAFRFDTSNYSTVSSIAKDLNLLQFSSTDLTNLFTKAIEIVNQGQVFARSCIQRYWGCVRSSQAIHVMELVGCVSAGIGVGTLSFFCAGCVGVGLYAVCATASVVHYNEMLAECRDNYDDCIN